LKWAIWKIGCISDNIDIFVGLGSSSNRRDYGDLFECSGCSRVFDLYVNFAKKSIINDILSQDRCFTNLLEDNTLMKFHLSLIVRIEVYDSSVGKRVLSFIDSFDGQKSISYEAFECIAVFINSFDSKINCLIEYHRVV